MFYHSMPFLLTATSVLDDMEEHELVAAESPGHWSGTRRRGHPDHGNRYHRLSQFPRAGDTIPAL